MSTTTAAVRRVVAELTARNLFALVVPTADPHNSEYVAPCFQRRAKLCGFRGSAGTCVVTRDSAALLWTDGRYWLEAEQTLDAGWTLMKQGDPATPTMEDWLQAAAQSYAESQQPQPQPQPQQPTAADTPAGDPAPRAVTGTRCSEHHPPFRAEERLGD